MDALEAVNIVGESQLLIGRHWWASIDRVSVEGDLLLITNHLEQSLALKDQEDENGARYRVKDPIGNIHAVAVHPCRRNRSGKVGKRIVSVVIVMAVSVHGY